MAEHIKTPWRTHNDTAVGTDVVLVANCDLPYGSPHADVREANAEFIVRCVNAHDYAKTALAAALGFISAHLDECTHVIEGEASVYHVVDKALAMMREGES